MASYSPHEISQFLATTKLFAHTPAKALHSIASAMELVHLAGDEVLFYERDNGDALYIVMYGYLHAVQRSEDGHERLLGDLRAGSVVGEIACLIDIERTATIYAVRDSILLKMSRESFNLFNKQYPEIMMGITRQSIERMVRPQKHSENKNASCFTLIPAGSYDQIESFSEALAETLSQFGKTLLLTQSLFETIHGPGSTDTPIHDPKNIAIVSWIQHMETQYRYIIYVASENNAWASRCIRQADQIFLISDLTTSPDVNELEELLFRKQSHSDSIIELVLITSSIKHGMHATTWLAQRPIKRLYKLRQGQKEDLQRFSRIISGNALGLVLSGGDADCLGHLGVLKALEELNISIDYIGGSGLGALLGSGIALGLDYQQLLAVIKRTLNKHRAAPKTFYAQFKKDLLTQLIAEVGEDALLIQDLMKNYFCISTNLNTNDMCIHEEGHLWHAISASIALPEVMPEFRDHKNHIHLDGGVLNNLPVDVMRSRIHNGKILTSSLSLEQVPKTTSVDTTCNDMAALIQKSITIGSYKHQKAMLNLADYNVVMQASFACHLDLNQLKSLITRSYESAVKILKTG